MDEAQRSGPTRRWLLAGGLAALLGAGGGVAAEVLWPRAAPAPLPEPPAALLAAVDAERALIADLDATTGGTPTVRRVIVQARADHAAHLAALHGALGHYRAPGAAAVSPTSPPKGTPRTLAQLRAAEHAASAAAGRRAEQLNGSPAALLASVAACEATHAELFR